MSDRLEFKDSEPLTLGVELELQLLTARDYDLTSGASDLLRVVQHDAATATSSWKSRRA